MKVAFIVKPFQVELLGIASLAAYLKKEGHEVVLSRIPDVYKEYDKLKGVDVLAFSITTGQHIEILQEARMLKKVYPNAMTVFGGPHPTYFP